MRRGQLVVRRRPGRAHRAHDAAAGRLDLEVARAGRAAPVLAGALAGEHRVRVRVDEAGQHAGALGVDHDGVVGDVDLAARASTSAPTQTMRRPGREGAAGQTPSSGARPPGRRASEPRPASS